MSVPIGQSPNKKDAQSNDTVNINIESSPSHGPRVDEQTKEQRLQGDAKDKLQKIKL